ncbi:cysteine hydrolase family protein [Nesterenkonia alkaliphila]|uniref:Isochorismatase family protein n=1 Tax=Nesterenkonia alkaliphila TaxID=1463631 RepID=A0A7K1UFI1_9MICC|nr:cysteine hydrolase family protein [Nesterenkonia alkaliphila]MVT25243.1 isochorismatase family protein [Nesterenkonia alkaliphila]GFZ91386.1 isochorismatase [Nesterenkonia alkaliphila]
MTAPSFSPGPKAALVVVDVQQAFGDVEFWGTRNNPECEKNIETLIAHWRKTGRPVVFVRHDSTNESSPLHPSSPGNQFKDVITGEPDLLVVKSVNSSFHGTPDLHQWLQQEGVTELVVCGITTNHCCETTARVGGNLGYQVFFTLDATHTFDRQSPEGEVIPADTLGKITATNLHEEFATITTTEELITA